MKKHLFSFLTLTVGLLFITHCGEEEPLGKGEFFNVASANSNHLWQKKVQKIKSTLKRSRIPRKNLSIYIQGTQSHLSFQINPHQKRTPASLTKLFTAATVLHFYPPHHRFHTYLSSPAPLHRKTQTLQGNLFLVGQGDPSFTSEQMWNLVNRFYRQPIKKIMGHIIVDDSHFSESSNLQIDAEKEEERTDNSDRAYNAPSSALSFNWNAVNIFIRPHEKIGQKAYVYLDPMNSYISLEGSIATVSSRQRKKIRAYRKISKEGKPLIFVDGKIPQNAKEVVIYKSITEPSLWAGHNLKEFLHQRGILVQGNVLKGKAPANSTLLTMQKGKTVVEIVTDMNKFSNNFISKMLLKKMLADRATSHETSNKALHPTSNKASALNQIPPSPKENNLLNVSAPSSILEPLNIFSQQVGIKQADFQLFDPSGLSKKNKLSALSIYKLLSYLYHQSPLRHEFISSLPIPGGDGTLRHRFKRLSLPQPLIRAKTGTLKGVVGLAGYAQQIDQKETFIFVLVYNGSGKEYQVQTLFDSISHILTLIKIN